MRCLVSHTANAPSAKTSLSLPACEDRLPQGKAPVRDSQGPTRILAKITNRSQLQVVMISCSVKGGGRMETQTEPNSAAERERQEKNTLQILVEEYRALHGDPPKGHSLD